jgi:hypothetical protein
MLIVSFDESLASDKAFRAFECVCNPERPLVLIGTTRELSCLVNKRERTQLAIFREEYNQLRRVEAAALV